MGNPKIILLAQLMRQSVLTNRVGGKRPKQLTATRQDRQYDDFTPPCHFPKFFPSLETQKRLLGEEVRAPRGYVLNLVGVASRLKRELGWAWRHLEGTLTVFGDVPAYLPFDADVAIPAFSFKRHGVLVNRRTLPRPGCKGNIERAFSLKKDEDMREAVDYFTKEMLRRVRKILPTKFYTQQ